MEKKDFATIGTQSYTLPTEEEKSKVVINIQEEGQSGVVLQKIQGRRSEISGSGLSAIFEKINFFFVEHSSISMEAKSQFFHLLSVMVNSGIPMVKALKALALQTEDSPRLKYIVQDLAGAIESGSSLSEALVVFSDVFTEQEIGMVQAGEASGQLSKVLENLADDTEKSYRIKSKIKGAMMYPIVIMVLLVGVVAAMMILVVPKLKDLFSSMGEELPLLTRIVLAISNFMVNQKLVLGISLLVLIFGFISFKKTALGKYLFDKFKLKMPIFGSIFKKAYLSRFARSLSNLLDSNVTILKTLQITANSIGNEVYRRRILLSQEDVKQGIPLAENLTESDLFPPMMVNMIEVGEQTAQMSEITQKIADFYENEVDTSVAGLSRIIEPVILSVIGVTVGTVVAAIMLPIMKLTDFAGNM